MFRTLLVAEDIDVGRRILEWLNQLNVEITAAFWFHYDEEDVWRLVIVSPEVSSRGPRYLYAAIAPLLFNLTNDPQKPVDFSLDQILLVNPQSLLYRQVKSGRGLTIRSGPVTAAVHPDVYAYKL